MKTYLNIQNTYSIKWLKHKLGSDRINNFLNDKNLYLKNQTSQKLAR